MAAARKFPGSWQYTAGRQRCIVYAMPGGHWRAVDCEAVEKRVRAAAG